MRHNLSVFICALIFCLPVAATASSVVDTVLFNASTNGAGDQAPGLGTAIEANSPLGGVDDPREAFGQNSGPIEPGTFLFSDGGVVDNGDGVLGNGGERVDYLRWRTTSPVVLNGYRVGLGSEGPSRNNYRGTELFAFAAAGERDDLFDDNGQNHPGSPVSRLFTVPQVGSQFEISLTRTTDGGPRLDEIDAIVPGGMPAGAFVNRTLFNAATNGAGDEAPGLGINFASSPTIPGDTIEDAFGNNNGGIEPSTLIFSDAGVADNRNNTFDPGTETIDWISWNTSSRVQIHGYEISLASDGPSEYRGAELVRFFVDGVLMDTIDFNHTSASIDRLLEGGPVYGSQFSIELTRTVGTGGPRLVEVDAIVPEPCSLALLFLAGLTLRRRER